MAKGFLYLVVEAFHSTVGLSVAEVAGTPVPTTVKISPKAH